MQLFRIPTDNKNANFTSSNLNVVNEITFFILFKCVRGFKMYLLPPTEKTTTTKKTNNHKT